MSLIYCPDCSHEVSTTAKSCPNCGHVITYKDLPKSETKMDLSSLIVILTVAFFLFCIMGAVIGIFMGILPILVFMGVFVVMAVLMTKSYLDDRKLED